MEVPASRSLLITSVLPEPPGVFTKTDCPGPCGTGEAIENCVQFEADASYMRARAATQDAGVCIEEQPRG
jgi:hypothetical protein